MNRLLQTIESFLDWFGALDVEYHVVVISAVTTLVVMIFGHKLRSWIGCKLGIHNWQFINLQRQENDFETYGRICWDDCLIQIWTSSGFVDRVEAYTIARRTSTPKNDPLIYVGDLLGTIDYMWSDAFPIIIKRINGDAVYEIMEQTAIRGYSDHPALRNEYLVYRGDLDTLFNCPTYRRRKSYDLKRWFRRQWRFAKNWIKSRLSNAMRWVRR